jgi:hypothetical protein
MRGGWTDRRKGSHRRARFRRRTFPVPCHVPHVIIVVADGARPDLIDAAIAAGEVPALARLRAEHGQHTLTTVFPSVTGPAYVPFLMGHHPGEVGLPALRWFDRSRRVASWPHYARSYVGVEMRNVDGDLNPATPTAFELAGGGVAMMNMIGRGLPHAHKLTNGLGFALRAGWTHFRGDVAGWLDVDRMLGARMLAHIEAHRPPFVYASFCGVDKTSHSEGHDAPIVRRALTIVDDFVAKVRASAERDGWWNDTLLCVVSDHGHVNVSHHDDLADLLRERGHTVLAHPKVFVRDPDVGVMVSGNAMAHLYMSLESKVRPWWPALANRWDPLVQELLRRPSVDLVALPHGEQRVEVRARDGRGSAMLTREGDRLNYLPQSGDPLEIGSELRGLSVHEAWLRTRETDYPDSLYQLLTLTACARTGDVLLSATRPWDFRGRYEPIPHLSSHGALHRDHMLVPFLSNRSLGTLYRTTEVFHHAMAALGVQGSVSVASPLAA